MTFLPEDEQGDEKNIDYLTERYLRCRMSDDDSARLLAFLERDDAHKEFVHENLMADTLLKDTAEEGDSLFPLPPIHVSRPTTGKTGDARSRRSALLFGTALFSGLVFSLLLVFGFLLRFPSDSSPRQALHLHSGQGNLDPIVEKVDRVPEETTTSAVAVVSKLVNAVWKADDSSLGAGSIVSPGWLRLESGMARVQFFSGVNVVIEGPTDFMVVGSNRAYCSSGKLLVEVPEQAIGFTINVPQMTVIDKGTAFSLFVSPEISEVHVLRGKVDLTEIPSGLEQLGEGEAASVDLRGTIRRFRSANPERTLATAFDEAILVHQNNQFRHWSETGQKINRNPTTLVRFDMEFLSDSDYRLLNNAESGKKTVGDGIVVGCRKGNGHLPQKGSLEFRQVSDRVRFHVPNRLHSFTLLARIRVDGTDRLFSSLLMSDGNEPGGIGWMICKENSPTGVPFLRFTVNGRDGAGTAFYDTPPFFTPERLGQWLDLALVADVGRQKVSQYVDGRLVSRLPMKHLSPIKLGRVELGNWNAPSEDSSYQIRHFSGGMDEFILFSHPMEQEEIKEIYDSCHTDNE